MLSWTGKSFPGCLRAPSLDVKEFLGRIKPCSAVMLGIIEIGGGFAALVLLRHRMYGSGHGGSGNILKSAQLS